MDERQKFLAQVAKEREERMRQNAISDVVEKIQSVARGRLSRKRFIQRFEKDFDEKFGLIYVEGKSSAALNSDFLKLGVLLLKLENRLEFVVRLGELCRKIAQSMFSNDKNATFAALFLDSGSKENALSFMKSLFIKIPQILSTIDLDKVTLHKATTAIVSFLVLLTSPNLWSLSKTDQKILSTMTEVCRKYSVCLLEPQQFSNLSSFLNICLRRTKPSQHADFVNNIVTVIYRVIKNSEFNEDEKITGLLAKNIYSCPGLMLLMNNTSLSLIKEAKTFEKNISLLSSNPNFLEQFSILKTLNFLANFVSISNFEQDLLVENLLEWTHVVNNFFTRIQSISNSKQRSFAHLILGFIPESDEKKQVHQIEKNNDLINRLMKRLTVKDQPDYSTHLGPVSLTAVVCQLYQNSILTFQKLHDDIILGLSHNSILKQLWNFICNNSPKGPTHYLLSLFSADPSGSLPHFAPFSLFAHIAYTQISSLDESEMYEEGIPFSIRQLCDIAQFTNTFCFKAIWDNIIDFKQEKAEIIFLSLHKLCMLLHNRDARRSFVNDKDFWLANVSKYSGIITEFEKRTPRGQILMSKMPHLVPLKERMMLFRRLVTSDKKEIEKKTGITTLVTIGRRTLVEDGFRQLSQMSTNELKAGFRIKFVNQQGLDEAGIDQDGVFKEFLELTMKGIFNPELNLFKVTTNGQFYPSNTSNIHENHLEYFRYIGRMLGKAVFDGFVVDIQLAPVILATILKKRLCAFDELATVDPDLYKNLTYIRKYKDSSDVADLELTFSVDEEFLGDIHTVDLPGGGRYTKVTNENKMKYVHQMAIYRVLTRTKMQTEAFVTGFRAIVNPDWLTLFSTFELQSLISGTRNDIDVADLKKNVQYYGGFHSNHRVIKWLWEIIENDFDAEERGLFLKFVTSCSRAPLLGFSYLEPPFSIRCIEVSDDQDQGDTLGSVVRGFLAIKKNKSTVRLPTSSTCFNLLKLPNYSKKSLLLEKLRYAIRAQAGFELS